MKNNNQGIMRRRDFPGAAIKQARGIAFGEKQFRHPFHRDESEKRDGACHAALFSDTQLVLNPGPIAVTTERGGRPARSV